jgi:hypothetical protein
MRKTAKSKGPSMLSIVTAIREPDMSFPMGLHGVAVESLIVAPVTTDDLRAANTKTLRTQRRLQNTLDDSGRRTLAKSLAPCEVNLILVWVVVRCQ